MTKVFLGVDIGSSRSHAILADEHGRGLGSGVAGPGNHEMVGYDGLEATLGEVINKAMQEAGVGKDRIVAAGFGVSGYDWPSEYTPTMATIRSLGLEAHLELVNDSLLGLFAGTEAGWGIAVVAGSGENCWGRDAHGKLGRMTGMGPLMGEYGGASTLVGRALQAVAAEWTRRGPPTAITEVFLEAADASDIADLLEGIAMDRYHLDAELAPRIISVAAEGDAVAGEIIHWAGEALGKLVNGVIRQLDFQTLSFDVVEIGGLFRGGVLLTAPLHATVHDFAPGARFVSLTVPPVVGAVILAMQATDVDHPAARQALLTGHYPF
jgi:N-acetylglucosamine kinase-like BadF-type ATPase